MQKRSFLPVIAEEHFQKLPDRFPVIFLGAKLAESSNYLHSHNFLEIGLCLEGSGIFMFRDRIVPFSKGDATAFPPGMPHFANSGPGVASRWVFIFFDPVMLLSCVCDRPEILSSAAMNDDKFPCVFNNRKFPEISCLIKNIVSLHDAKKEWFETEIRAVLLQLFIEISRASGSGRKNIDTDGRQDFSAIERISPALNHIAGSYKNQLKIRSLAKLCGVSVETLRRLFRKAVGKSPESYVQHMRIQVAASLLENTNDPIGEISFRTGYQSVSCFNRQFRKLMDSSPREWRRKNS
ncbi:MAG TPA: hypothetical protein DCZ94_06880 [Lentisphaeria bacterium]|nr:MAG: hypothetical protein A2X48_10505 [Lentisphaerae bacterium GWF2_49_21]HBC86658.1 hypothetical protein [Lentisphaeria bacterium]